jgi:hypothetical protein
MFKRRLATTKGPGTFFEALRSAILGVITTVAFVVVCFPSGQKAVADIVPGTVSSDPFDSTQGTVVVNDDTIIDPINAFRTSGGFEDGHTLMRNGGLGSLSFIEFDTAAPVSIVGVRLFAHNDLPYCLRRAMNHFTLLADTDNDTVFETLVVDVDIDPNYQYQPGNIAVDLSNLDLTLFASSVITAQHWRLEVTQGSNIQPYEGARLVELDAIAAPLIPVDIDIKPGSYPNSINNDGHGVIPVAILGNADFDVTLIVPETVALAGMAIKAVGKANKLLSHYEDVNGDGFDDLVVQIEDADGTLTEGTTEATLTGELMDGTLIEGSDEITIVP